MLVEEYSSQFDSAIKLSCRAVDSLCRALNLVVEAAISGGSTSRACGTVAGDGHQQTHSMKDIVDDLSALEAAVDAVSIAAGKLRAQVKEELSAVLKSLAESHTRMDNLRQDFVHVAGQAQSSSSATTSAAGFRSNRTSTGNAGGRNLGVSRKLLAASTSAREQMDKLKAETATLFSQSEALRAKLKGLGNLRTTAARWRNWCRLAATRLQAHEVRRAEALQLILNCFTKLTAALQIRAVSMSEGAIRALNASNHQLRKVPLSSSSPSATSPQTDAKRLAHRHLLEFQDVLSRFGPSSARPDAVPIVPVLPSAFRLHGELLSHRAMNLVPALKKLMVLSAVATVSPGPKACQIEKAQGNHPDANLSVQHDALRRFLGYVSATTTTNKEFIEQHFTTFRECLLSMMSPGIVGQTHDSKDKDVSTVPKLRDLLSVLGREFLRRDDSFSDFCSISNSIKAAKHAVFDAIQLLQCELPPAQSGSHLLDVRVAAETFGSQVCALLLADRWRVGRGTKLESTAPLDSALHGIPTCFGNVAERSLGLLLQGGNTVAEGDPRLDAAFLAAAESLETCDACISHLAPGLASNAPRKLSPTVRRVARASSRSKPPTNTVARSAQSTNGSVSGCSEWTRLLQQPLDGLVQRLIELYKQKNHSPNQNGARLRQRNVVGSKTMSRHSRRTTKLAHREPTRASETAAGVRSRRGKRFQRLLCDETEPTNDQSERRDHMHAGRTKVAWEEI